MTFRELLQFEEDATHEMDFEPCAIDDQIDTLMKLVMSEKTTSGPATRERVELLINLGLQLLEIQDMLYDHLREEEKWALNEPTESPLKHRFSQVRM